MTDQQQPASGQPASLAQEYEDWVQQLVVAHREQRAEVESLRQQLAAVQAERDSKQAVLEAYGRQTQKDMAERDQLRAQVEALRGVVEKGHAYSGAVLAQETHERDCQDSPCADCERLGWATRASETALFKDLAALNAASAGQPRSDG